MTKVVTGIILKLDKHKERDARLSILTADGVLSVYAMGLMGAGSKLKSVLGQFNLVEVTVSGSKITGANLLANSIGLTKDIHRFYLACSMADCLLTLCREADEDVFNLAVACYVLLANTEVSAFKILLHFFARLLEILGYAAAEEFPHSDKIGEFKTSKIETLDDLELGYGVAKQCVRELARAYRESLDYELVSLDVFLQG